MLIIYSLRQAQFFGIFTLLKLHVQFQPQLQPPLWRFKRKFQREVGTMQESFSCQQTVNRSRSNLIVKNAVNVVIQKCSFTYTYGNKLAYLEIWFSHSGLPRNYHLSASESRVHFSFGVLFQKTTRSFYGHSTKLELTPYVYFYFLMQTPLEPDFPFLAHQYTKRKEKTCQETLNGFLIMYNREEQIHVL